MIDRDFLGHMFFMFFFSFLLPEFILSSENYPCKFKQNLWNSKHIDMNIYLI